MDLRYLTFEKKLGMPLHNVESHPLSAPISFTNWNGDFAGETFDLDPRDVIGWKAPEHTELSSFQAIPGPGQVCIAFETTAEVDVAAFVLERSPRPGMPFVPLEEELTPVGPGAYQFVDGSLTAGFEQHYRLSERLTHGPLRTLKEDSATPYGTDPPTNLVTVGAGGAFADIQAAIQALPSTGEGFVVVQPGTYASFVVSPAAGQDVHVLADGTGTVQIDPSAGPVAVHATAASTTVSLHGLEILGSSAHPSVEVRGALGPVILDALVVTGGTDQAGIHVSDSAAVAVQTAIASGSPGLQVTDGSRVYAGRGSLDELEASGLSVVETCGLTPAQTFLQGGATLTPLPGVMPAISMPRLLVLKDSFDIVVEVGPGEFWRLDFSPGFLAAAPGTPQFEMLSLLDPQGAMAIASGMGDPVSGVSTLTFTLPAQAALLGNGLGFQARSLVSPLTGPKVRFSNAITALPLPQALQ